MNIVRRGSPLSAAWSTVKQKSKKEQDKIPGASGKRTKLTINKVLKEAAVAAVNELSQNTLRKYTDRANDSRDSAASKYHDAISTSAKSSKHHDTIKKVQRIISKRTKGMKMASKKAGC